MGTAFGTSASREWEALIKEKDFVVEPGSKSFLGKGGQATVYKATLGGKTIAAKQFNWVEELQVLDKEALEKSFVDGKLFRWEREILIHSKLDHKNIVKFLGVTSTWKYGMRIPKYLLLEYMEGGSLKDKSLNPENINVKRLQRVLGYLVDIANAVHYLHSQEPDPILHRDIKPENVLLSAQGVVKLADLGLAKHYNPSRSDTVDGPQTADYVAPEVKRGEQYSVRSDMFSFGMTAFVLLGNLDPASRRQFAEFYQTCSEIANQHFMLGMGQKLLACLREDPGRRPTATEMEEALCKYRQFRAELPQARAALQEADRVDLEFLNGSAVKLVVNDKSFSEEETKALATVLEAKADLQELRFDNCQLGEAFPSLMNVLPRFSDQLRKVSLTRLITNTDDKEWVRCLISVLPCMRKLEVLELQSNAAGEAILGLPKALKNLDKLKLLDLSNNGSHKVDTVKSIMNAIPLTCSLKFTWALAGVAKEEIEKDWNTAGRTGMPDL